MPRRRSLKEESAASVEEATPLIAVVDFSQSAYRWLFQPLYTAALEQALLMGDTEEYVKVKFAQLVAGNPQHGFIAQILEDKVQSHCLYRLENRDIVIEQFCGTQEFITTVQTSFEDEAFPGGGIRKILYLIDPVNADFFIDELGYTEEKVLLVKYLQKDEEEE